MKFRSGARALLVSAVILTGLMSFASGPAGAKAVSTASSSTIQGPLICPCIPPDPCGCPPVHIIWPWWTTALATGGGFAASKNFTVKGYSISLSLSGTTTEGSTAITKETVKGSAPVTPTSGAVGTGTFSENVQTTNCNYVLNGTVTAPAGKTAIPESFNYKTKYIGNWKKHDWKWVFTLKAVWTAPTSS